MSLSSSANITKNSNIRILVSSKGSAASNNHVVIRDTECLQTLNQAYANILEKHVDKQDVANWNVELDWNDGPYVKFTHNITNATCKSVPELVSHTQGQKRKAQKNTKYLNDIRNTIPKQNSKDVACSLHTDIDEDSLALIRKLTNEDGCGRSNNGGDSGKWVRRSRRASGQSAVQSREVQELIAMIKSNHPDTIVFKVKNYISSDVNCFVLNAILHALMENTVCQSLYIQNFNEGLLDDQFELLTEVLKKGHIWCLNIGEIYKVTPSAWTKFAKSLADTNVTHMYASEHVITGAQKTLFRDVIRENRKKHDRHNSLYNLNVIQRCTNCWWNPIHSHKLAREIQESRETN